MFLWLGKKYYYFAKGVFIHMHEINFQCPQGGHNSSKDFDSETTGVSGKSLHISIYKK